MGQLRTKDSIELGQRLIRYWLGKIGVAGLSITSNYDARINIAILGFKYKENKYEFRSTRQKNCRLNVHAIARVMEFKVRAHLMKIEDFGGSMRAYLQLENKSSYAPPSDVIADDKSYADLGVDPSASNDEIKARYRQLMRGFHPDMALSDEAKKEFERRSGEINAAYAQIAKARMIT